VKDVVFYPDDQSMDRELKMAMLDIYRSRLEKRVERKRIATTLGVLPRLKPGTGV
jgi:transcriptional adapter 2-alpha